MVGLGKMGLSHLAIVRAHPEVELVAACDTTTYLTDILTKYSNLKCYASFDEMLAKEQLDALLVATPSTLHAGMVGKALERGLHVFCEKPFVLDSKDGQKLVELADQKNLVTQVGYHYRFVGAFKEAARIVKSGALGKIHHVRAEAYGPVVLRQKGMTWRSAKNQAAGRSTITPATPSTWSTLCSRRLRRFTAVCSTGSSRTTLRTRSIAPLRSPTERVPTGSQLERRKLPENVDQDLCLGDQWSDYRRSTRVSDLSPATAGFLAWRRRRLDCPLHNRSHRRGLVLPAGRGILRADRLLCAKHQARSQGWSEQFQVCAGNRPDRRNDLVGQRGDRQDWGRHATCGVARRSQGPDR
ncbi:Glucose--fructose oxidoreductase precursor [Methylibium sp. T29]|nr:Glucose--fructose oxidoreductase precursor [Methylibium sp. T29]